MAMNREEKMKSNLMLAGAFSAALAAPAMAIGANESYYIYHDMAAKKCSVVKTKPTTGIVGTGEIYPSEEAAKAAIEKSSECTNKGT
jgi:hypothetical protein